MDYLGREGVLDDTKPTKYETIRKQLENNEIKMQRNNLGYYKEVELRSQDKKRRIVRLCDIKDLIKRKHLILDFPLRHGMELVEPSVYTIFLKSKKEYNKEVLSWLYFHFKDRDYCLHNIEHWK